MTPYTICMIHILISHSWVILFTSNACIHNMANAIALASRSCVLCFDFCRVKYFLMFVDWMGRRLPCPLSSLRNMQLFLHISYASLLRIRLKPGIIGHNFRGQILIRKGKCSMGGVGTAVEIWALKRVDKPIQLPITGWARDAGYQPWPGEGPVWGLVWGRTMTRRII